MAIKGSPTKMHGLAAPTQAHRFGGLHRVRLRTEIPRVRERSKGSADCPAGSLIMWVRSHHKGSAKAQKGVSNGVPFLCWPYFAEQYFNKTYICDIWKTCVGLNKDDAGIVTREEIKSKVEELLSNNIIKENALTLQERVINSLQSGNSSNQNFKNFIDWIKEGNNRAHIDETFK
ncbi:hypothetical protein E3N88_06861 [Mikania micrantha]|uniref:Uncharacterized protein n=1 Tax=Mikania micrantha TaxID=192012 RepID=A0A5N6PRZ3_9ASTR|nr:hypothetical protein E3N88_06861 [Mikania micrantha]